MIKVNTFLFFLLIHFIVGCNLQSNVDTPYIGTWIELTKINNEYVIYKPCTLDIRLMRISNIEVYERLPSEVNKSKITEVSKLGNETYFLSFGQNNGYTFKWKDKEHHVCEFDIKYSESSSKEKYVFVDSVYAKNFKTITQPQSECETKKEETSGIKSIKDYLIDYLPEYKITSELKGDANNDGIEDVLVVLTDKIEEDKEKYDEKLLHLDKNNEVYRNLILFKGNRENQFQKVFENKKLIPSALFGGEMKASYDIPKINTGEIVLVSNEQLYATKEIRKMTFTFVYDPALSNWLCKSINVKCTTEEDKVINNYTITSTNFGVIPIQSFNIYEFDPKKYNIKDESMFVR